MIFLTLKMNNLHDNVTSHAIENVWKTSSFTYISTWENNKRLNLLLKDLPSKALQKLHKPILLMNQKILLTLSCRLFILSIRKIIRTDRKKFNHTVFVELLTAHLLEKNSRFYHLLKLRYMQNKKCYTLKWKKNITYFFLTGSLDFKLHLMFNVNTSKDAARSGLSCYI